MLNTIRTQVTRNSHSTLRMSHLNQFRPGTFVMLIVDFVFSMMK